MWSGPEVGHSAKVAFLARRHPIEADAEEAVVVGPIADDDQIAIEQATLKPGSTFRDLCADRIARNQTDRFPPARVPKKGNLHRRSHRTPVP